MVRNIQNIAVYRPRITIYWNGEESAEEISIFTLHIWWGGWSCPVQVIKDHFWGREGMILKRFRVSCLLLLFFSDSFIRMSYLIQKRSNRLFLLMQLLFWMYWRYFSLSISYWLLTINYSILLFTYNGYTHFPFCI